MNIRDPYRYLSPAMVSQRMSCLRWIMKRRAKGLIQPGKLWLARLPDTPQAIARSWANGDLPATILQTAASMAIGALFGCMYGLYI